MEPAAEELGGEEVLEDYEVETEPEAETETAAAAVAAEANAPAVPPPAAAVAPRWSDAVVKPDDLTQLDGIGPKAAECLVGGGHHHVSTHCQRPTNRRSGVLSTRRTWPRRRTWGPGRCRPSSPPTATGAGS